MDFSRLNNNNFILYVSKYYENPQCDSMDEFNEDLNRVKYIKRLLRKYIKTGILRERLILNHLIILQNVFGPKVTSRVLFFKVDDELYSELKTFLVYLKYLPDSIPEVNLEEIPLDNKIVSVLREI
jgi:hypothetical protein|tara:strand:+ start:9277 stop:9654 length:378 start_codon:yes stop_codon:yes gene_type:complete